MVLQDKSAVFHKTVPLDPASNCGFVRSASGYHNFNAFTSHIPSTEPMCFHSLNEFNPDTENSDFTDSFPSVASCAALVVLMARPPERHGVLARFQLPFTHVHNQER